MTTIETIKILLDECEAGAMSNGWAGKWEPLEADMEHVARGLGRAPRHSFSSDELDAIGIAPAFRSAWLTEAE